MWIEISLILLNYTPACTYSFTRAYVPWLYIYKHILVTFLIHVQCSTVWYESVLVPHSSQLGCRNFQFAEVEISSLNSKFPVGMSKFPVCRSRNFEFELEISSWDVEISSLPKSKFRVWKSKFPVWNSKFTVWNSKFPVWNSKFPLWTRNYQFDEVEISSCWLVI